MLQGPAGVLVSLLGRHLEQGERDGVVLRHAAAVRIHPAETELRLRMPRPRGATIELVRLSKVLIDPQDSLGKPDALGSAGRTRPNGRRDEGPTALRSRPRSLLKQIRATSMHRTLWPLPPH